MATAGVFFVAPESAKGAADGSLTVTAAGSTQATATVLRGNVNHVTTVAASTGVALPAGAGAGEVVFVRNGGANALTVYPATAAGTISAGSAGAGVSLATTTELTKNSMFVCLGNDVWVRYVSA